MMVCAHGNVSEFCEKRDMVICERYNGDLYSYDGGCPVLVTDQDMTESEYYYLKERLLRRGIDLVSVQYTDNPVVMDFMAYAAKRRKENYGGRQIFGYYRKNGEVIENPEMIAVVHKILELRDAGYTLRQIQTDEDVHHPDGRKISISTIQQIIKNREKYERK